MRTDNRIILHVGPTKTGTSAIQWTLVRNKEVLEKQDIGCFLPEHQYNSWSNSANAAFLMRAAMEKSGISVGEGDYWSRQALQEDIDLFVDYCTRYHTQILSEESFWNQGIRVQNLWNNLRDVIYECCGNDVTIDIIAYLRRQDERVVSKWKQRTRGQLTQGDDFRTMAKKIEDEGLLDYEKVLHALAECFGRDHIIVRSYHDAVNEGGIVSDFLRCIGMNSLEEMKYMDMAINQSLSLNMTEACRLINAGIVKCNAKDTVRYVMRRLYSFENHDLNEYPLPYEERHELIQRYKESNNRVAEEFLGRKELFSDEIEEYTVWKPNPERDLRNANVLANLAERIELFRQKNANN